MAKRPSMYSCKRCGKPFTKDQWGQRWSNFCSEECVTAHKVQLGHLQASHLEQNFAEQLSDAGLVGQSQFPLGPYIFDLAFPQVQLLVEIDGEMFHSTVQAQERDDRKDALAKKYSWRIVHVPQGIIERQPTEALRIVMDAYFNRSESLDRADSPCSLN